MLWYLADSSLNDYLKSQVVLQGQYYSGQKIDVKQANFTSHNGVLILEQLTLANTKDYLPKDSVIIEQVLVQLAPVPASSEQKKHNNDISKKVQHIKVDKVTINKLRFNLIKNIASNGVSNLSQLQQQISQKLAIDYPALYPEIAAKTYAKQHPEMNAELAAALAKDSTQKPMGEINPAVIEAKANKQKKRLLGKATTRITIAAFIIDSLEVHQINKDGKSTIQHFSNVELPVIGKEHGLASNQVGGEVLRLILDKVAQLQKVS